MINITHILWRPPQSIEIILSRLAPGDNVVNITVNDRTGTRLFPNKIVVNRENAINIYGITKVQKNKTLDGIRIPTIDITNGRFKNA